MPLEGKEALGFIALIDSITERANEGRADRLVEAKLHAAATGKELFDYEKLCGMAATVFDMTQYMTDAERAEFFERQYYLGYPQTATLAEFADHVNVLSQWM